MTIDTPTTHKTVAVLNKKIEVGRAMNALWHMALGLGASYPDKNGLRLDTYVGKNGELHPNISDNPFIVLSAENSNKIRTLRKTLIEAGIPFVDFIDTMTVGTFAEQKQRTIETADEDLEYFGICFFGEADQLRELTKKFSLWK